MGTYKPPTNITELEEISYGNNDKRRERYTKNLNTAKVDEENLSEKEIRKFLESRNFDLKRIKSSNMEGERLPDYKDEKNNIIFEVKGGYASDEISKKELHLILNEVILAFEDKKIEKGYSYVGVSYVNVLMDDLYLKRFAFFTNFLISNFFKKNKLDAWLFYFQNSLPENSDKEPFAIIKEERLREIFKRKQIKVLSIEEVIDKTRKELTNAFNNRKN